MSEPARLKTLNLIGHFNVSLISVSVWVILVEQYLIHNNEDYLMTSVRSNY